MSWTTPRTYVAGEIVTAAMLNEQLRDNMKEVWREVDYAAITAAANITATTAATADTVITGATFTPAATVMLIEFSAPAIDGTSIQVTVWEDSTDIGGIEINTTNGRVPGRGMLRRTPTTASHTYRIKAYVSSGTGHIYAGAGGVASDAPAFMRIMQKGS